MTLLLLNGRVCALGLPEKDVSKEVAPKDVELNINTENKLKINMTAPVKKIDKPACKSKEEFLQYRCNHTE